MPAAYAHYRFGESCIDSMPEKLQKLCIRYREIFDFGVHGPDVLFYYHPLSSNDVNRYGSDLHHWTGTDFFGMCKNVYQDSEMSKEQKNALLAYLLGFLAHFTLDSCCHGYINERAANTELSHNLIESQYEAFLMRKDGQEPLKVDRGRLLRPSPARAEVMSMLFPFDKKDVLVSMKGQKKTLHLFYSPTQLKKRLIRKAIQMLKVKGDFGDLFLDKEVYRICAETNEQIFIYQQKATEIYPKLLWSLVNYLNDRGELDVHFLYDFEGEDHSGDL